MSDSVSPSSESKPKPCFSHLPWNVKQRIVDKTDLITRFTTRKVCKELRTHVDKSSFHHKRILFTLFKTRLTMEINGRDVFYEKNPDAGPESTEFVQRAAKDLAILLKSSRVSVGMLSFEADLESFHDCSTPEYRNEYDRNRKMGQETLKEELNKLNHKLHVQLLNVLFLVEEEIMFIIPYLKPKILEKMRLNGFLQNPVARLDRLVETEHWKQTDINICFGCKGLPIWATAFPKSALVHEGAASLEELKQLIQIILEDSSDKQVNIAAVSLDYNFQEFEEYVQQFEQRATKPWNRFVPIPNTKLFLSILFSVQDLFLRKISREEMHGLS